MLKNTEKTLFKNDQGLILWITFINPELFQLNVTDKMTYATYGLAEYDGFKYTILNAKAFDGFYLKLLKEHPQIINEIREFMNFHKPENQTLNAMSNRLSGKCQNWFKTKKKSK